MTPPPISSNTPSAPGSSPAFKEWASLVAALGLGQQILILRKGGIAEGRLGFQVDRAKFWLFATHFHQQWDKTRPELRTWIENDTSATAQVALGVSNGTASSPSSFVVEYAAEVVGNCYLEDWSQVQALAPFHFWREEIVRERFTYQDRPGMTPGLHALVVRVSRTESPFLLPAAPEFGGCKSWIEVPLEFAKIPLDPVLTETSFSDRLARIQAVLPQITRTERDFP